MRVLSCALKAAIRCREKPLVWDSSSGEVTLTPMHIQRLLGLQDHCDQNYCKQLSTKMLFFSSILMNLVIVTDTHSFGDKKTNTIQKRFQKLTFYMSGQDGKAGQLQKSSVLTGQETSLVFSSDSLLLTKRVFMKIEFSNNDFALIMKFTQKSLKKSLFSGDFEGERSLSKTRKAVLREQFSGSCRVRGHI